MLSHVRRKKEKTKGGVSVCLAGVDYWNPHVREIVQYWRLLGASHVYLGLPALPTNPWFEHVHHNLIDFLNEGVASVASVAPADCLIYELRDGHLYHSEGRTSPPVPGPRRCMAPRGYRPTGSQSIFQHACLMHARRHGDGWVFIGDYDDMVVPVERDSNKTLRRILNDIAKRYGFKDPSKACAINLRLWDMFGPGNDGARKVGPWLDDRWPYASPALKAREMDRQAAGLYGKSFQNAQRVLRFGFHMVANCEGATDDRELEIQSWGDDDPPLRHDVPSLVVRSNLTDIGAMHYVNMFRTRGYHGKVGSPGQYTLRWGGRVRSALEQRAHKYGIPPHGPDALKEESRRNEGKNERRGRKERERSRGRK
eukprot:Hpha_TRINITY_DN8543_c0_g1::TRINITY_DN8543_c0_g1_i1::g.146350::m.146350